MVVPIVGSTRASDSDLGVGRAANAANQMDISYDGPPHLTSLVGSNKTLIMRLDLEVQHRVEGE